jgi:hypothetical protein
MEETNDDHHLESTAWLYLARLTVCLNWTTIDLANLDTIRRWHLPIASKVKASLRAKIRIAYAIVLDHALQAHA